MVLFFLLQGTTLGFVFAKEPRGVWSAPTVKGGAEGAWEVGNCETVGGKAVIVGKRFVPERLFVGRDGKLGLACGGVQTKRPLRHEEEKL